MAMCITKLHVTNWDVQVTMLVLTCVGRVCLACLMRGGGEPRCRAEPLAKSRIGIAACSADRLTNLTLHTYHACRTSTISGGRKEALGIFPVFCSHLSNARCCGVEFSALPASRQELDRWWCVARAPSYQPSPTSPFPVPTASTLPISIARPVELHLLILHRHPYHTTLFTALRISTPSIEACSARPAARRYGFGLF